MKKTVKKTPKVLPKAKTPKLPARNRNFGIPKRKKEFVREPTKYFKEVNTREGKKTIEVPAPGTAKKKKTT